MIVDTPHRPVSADQTGDGPHLVLLHSLLSDRHVFDPVVPRLAETHTVTMMDLPGFGSTPRVEPGIDNYAHVVGGLLGAIGADPETAVVMGNGLGGFVALGTAVNHGDKFRRLVLAGAGAAFPGDAKGAFHTMIDKVQTGGMDAVVDIAVRRIYTDEFLHEHPDMADERKRVLRRTDPAAFVDACRSLIALDYRQEAATVENHALVIVGSEDAATPPALGMDLAQRMPHAAFHELPGLAHAPQLQDPDTFLDSVTHFLEDVG